MEKERINEFTVGYLISQNLNINNSFIEKVDKCMTATFGQITQNHIRATLSKNKTRVLALLLFYETRAYNPKKTFKLLSCVINTIIKSYVYTDYLACQCKKIQ